MQVEAFGPLLEKYGDVETNPGAEPFEEILRRFEMPGSCYHLILLEETIVGAIRVVTLKTGTAARISPMFIRPSLQGRGIGRRGLEMVEEAYPDIRRWELDTIIEEESLCRFYEHSGYSPTGKEESVQPGLTIRYYEKFRQPGPTDG